MKLLFSALVLMLVTLTSARTSDYTGFSDSIENQTTVNAPVEVAPIEAAYTDIGQISVDNRAAFVKAGQSINKIVAGQIVERHYFNYLLEQRLWKSAFPLATTHDGVYNGIDCTAGESDNYCCYYGATTVFCIKKEKGIK